MNPQPTEEEAPKAGKGPEEEEITEEASTDRAAVEDQATIDQPDPDANLKWPEEENPSGEGKPTEEEVVIQDAQFDQIKPPQSTGKGNNIDLLLDVNLPISVQLGKTSMTIQELLEISPGSVIELDKMVGSPVEILANDKTIAQGEVVVVDENFGVRITSLLSPAERIKSLR